MVQKSRCLYNRGNSLLEKGKMETVTITSKAKWTLQELIPIVITLALGLFGLFAGITGYFVFGGAVTTAVVGFGLLALIMYTNIHRKYKSTLYAKLSNDKNFNIEVWMRKPLKDKWQGKMDAGNNKGALSKLNNIKMDTLRGTRLVVLELNSGKPVIIPVRLAETDGVRSYLAEAIKARGNKVKFENDNNMREFTAILKGETYDGPKRPASKTTGAKLAPAPKAKPVEQNIESETSVENTVETVKPVKKIGYGNLPKKDTSKSMDTVAERIQNHDAEVKEDKNVTTDDTSLLLGGKNVSSVSIDFGDNK